MTTKPCVILGDSVPCAFCGASLALWGRPSMLDPTARNARDVSYALMCPRCGTGTSLDDAAWEVRDDGRRALDCYNCRRSPRAHSNGHCLFGSTTYVPFAFKWYGGSNG